MTLHTDAPEWRGEPDLLVRRLLVDHVGRLFAELKRQHAALSTSRFLESVPQDFKICDRAMDDIGVWTRQRYAHCTRLRGAGRLGHPTMSR